MYPFLLYRCSGMDSGIVPFTMSIHPSIVSLLRLSASIACLLGTLNAMAADGDTGLGSASGLNGDVDNGAVALPSGGGVNIPRGVRPVIVLPPESLQPHTLVVPLPSENSPPVILRRNSIEAVPSLHPVLPQSTTGTKPGNKYPPPPPPKNSSSEEKSNGSTIRTTPLDPIVY